VDPAGDQMLCSDTNLTPDDTDMLSNCPIMKSSLTTGDWSVIVISNNGDSGDPIAYERDFSLTVGPQSTSTVRQPFSQSTNCLPKYKVHSYGDRNDHFDSSLELDIHYDQHTVQHTGP
jgi:hypothetical protein